MRPLLADLEQETRQALKTLYGFSEIGARTRREAEPQSPAGEGTQPRFLNLIPLLVFGEGDTSKATDFRTGRKRKVSGTIIHKAADVVRVPESKEVVGFQLVSARADVGGHKVSWRAGARVGFSLAVGPTVPQGETPPVGMNPLRATEMDPAYLRQKANALEGDQQLREASQGTEMRDGPGIPGGGVM